MSTGEVGIVADSGIAYVSGDLALTANQYCTAAGIVTPTGTKRLAFTVWLSTVRTMYVVDADGNLGAIGVTLSADAPASWEMPWDGSKAFSIRFSGACTVRKIIINGE